LIAERELEPDASVSLGYWEVGINQDELSKVAVTTAPFTIELGHLKTPTDLCRFLCTLDGCQPRRPATERTERTWRAKTLRDRSAIGATSCSPRDPAAWRRGAPGLTMRAVCRTAD